MCRLPFCVLFPTWPKTLTIFLIIYIHIYVGITCEYRPHGLLATSVTPWGSEKRAFLPPFMGSWWKHVSPQPRTMIVYVCTVCVHSGTSSIHWKMANWVRSRCRWIECDLSVLLIGMKLPHAVSTVITFVRAVPTYCKHTWAAEVPLLISICSWTHYNIQYIQLFRGFSPDCTLHTAITHVISVLERWRSRMITQSEFTWDSIVPILLSREWLQCAMCIRD